MKYFLCTVLMFSLVTNVLGEKYRVSPWEKAFIRQGEGSNSQVLFEIPGKDLVSIRAITPSPDGKVAYVEIVNTTTSRAPYSEFASQHWEKPYNPEMIDQRFHVCTLKGEVLQTIDIKMKETTNVNYLWFYGESYVGLAFLSRVVGWVSEAFVSLKTGEIWSFERSYKTPVVAAASPDNQYLCCLLTDSETSASAVFLNGKQIFPYFDRAPRLKSFSPDKFQKADKKFRDWVAEHPGRHLIGGQRSPEQRPPAWSPDSRYVAFLLSEETTPRNPDDYNKDKDKPGKAQFLVFDIKAVQAGKKIKDYLKRIPFTVPNRDLLYALENYSPVWSTDVKRLSVKDSEGKRTDIEEIPFEVK
ncbi:MAG TPA: hypothetical protein PLA90_15975 [Candidatus Sumerlaeota bacterium]|nr:hypothetical protein [Candidatus Sumerlaeota bacterium]